MSDEANRKLAEHLADQSMRSRDIEMPDVMSGRERQQGIPEMERILGMRQMPKPRYTGGDDSGRARDGSQISPELLARIRAVQKMPYDEDSRMLSELQSLTAYGAGVPNEGVVPMATLPRAKLGIPETDVWGQPAAGVDMNKASPELQTYLRRKASEQGFERGQ